MPANDDNARATRADLRRIAEAIIGNICDLRTEMNGRFDQCFGQVDQRFTAVEQRLDRVESNTTAILLQTVGMGKSITDGQRLVSQITATQAARQRAIDDLYHQLGELKRKSQ